MTKDKIIDDYFDAVHGCNFTTFSVVQAAIRWLKAGYDIREFRRHVCLTEQQQIIAEDCVRFS